MDNKTFKQNFEQIADRIGNALDEGYETLCSLCKENGGVVRTIPTDAKPFLRAYFEDCIDGQNSEIIYGIRYDEELGLTLCTSSMIDNYTYDTGYYFTDEYDFEGEDLEEIEKMLDDAAYFVEIDKYGLIRVDTLMSLINGIGNYI